MKKGDGVNNDCDSAEGEEINNGLGMKGLTSWLSCVMFPCVFITFPSVGPGPLLYLIVSIPDLCFLSCLCMNMRVHYWFLWKGLLVYFPSVLSNIRPKLDPTIATMYNLDALILLPCNYQNYQYTESKF